MSDLRWRRGESRQRLLDAALSAIAEAGATGVSGRTIAQAAGVHHAQIQQMFGSVDGLINSALLDGRDRLLAEAFPVPGHLPDPFSLFEHPPFWRATTQVVLDPGPIDLAALADGGPVQRVETELRPIVQDEVHRLAIAGAWVSIPLGYTVFEQTFESRLGLSKAQMASGLQQVKTRLSQLVETDRPTAALKKTATTTATAADCGDRTTHGSASPKSTGSAPKETARCLLVSAAQDLLASRVETSVTGRELASHAGVNYGLINHYFGSKAAVFDEALVNLHSELTDHAVRHTSGETSLAGPEVFTKHRAFIRAWVSRLIGDRSVPDFDLVGMRAMIEHTARRRAVDPTQPEVVGDVMAAMSLGLGWAVLSPLPTAANSSSEQLVTAQVYQIHRWLLGGSA